MSDESISNRDAPGNCGGTEGGHSDSDSDATVPFVIPAEVIAAATSNNDDGGKNYESGSSVEQESNDANNCRDGVDNGVVAPAPAAPPAAAAPAAAAAAAPPDDAAEVIPPEQGRAAAVDNREVAAPEVFHPEQDEDEWFDAYVDGGGFMRELEVRAQERRDNEERQRVRIEADRRQREEEADRQRERRDALNLDHWDNVMLDRVTNQLRDILPRLEGHAVLLIHQLQPSPLLVDPDVAVERSLHTIAYTNGSDRELLEEHLNWENGFPLMTFYRRNMSTEIYNIPDDDNDFNIWAREMSTTVELDSDLDRYAFNVFVDLVDTARNGLWRDEE